MVTSRPGRAEPVDVHVRKALGEIERAERQFAKLAGERDAWIQVIARRVEDAATRLESSPNRDHPSWRAVNDRIDTLMLHLARWNTSVSAATH